MALASHGLSSGERLTYGMVEKRDVSQVLDELARRGLLAGAVAACGYSYGGAVAIEHAAIDARVGAVIAIAPFSTLRAAIQSHARRFLPLHDEAGRDRWVDAVLVEASSLARADLAAAQPISAARSRPVPLLLVHGARDRHLPVEHSEALFSANLGPSALLILRGVGHNDVFRKALEPVARETILWLDRWLDRDRTSDRKDSP